MRADGPYCPWPQDTSRYVHEVYPRSRALGLNPDGTTREATDAEQESLDEMYRAHLRRYSFRLLPPA